MERTPLEVQYKIVAGAPNVGDFVGLLELLRNAVNDVRFPVAVKDGTDSLEIRKAVDNVLTTSLDKLKALRENKKQHGKPRDTDDSDTLSMGDQSDDSDLL